MKLILSNLIYGYKIIPVTVPNKTIPKFFRNNKWTRIAKISSKIKQNKVGLSAKVLNCTAKLQQLK